jgi:prolyl-tRNA synthetase
VVRWEKEARPFLRSWESLWQEGHTAHATAEESHERTIQMQNVYADFCEQTLAIPVIKGQKTEKEKFAGAVDTYTIEALMHDGKALQCGTSHDFGDGFARAFDVQYTGKDNKLQYVHQTSFGMTTRMIGAVIMVHGDDSGLVLPPAVAPVQIMIIPIQQKKEGVLEAANRLLEALGDFRVALDDSDRSPGYKYAEQEMRGIPLRVELGPRDLENGSCVIARRDNGEKEEVRIDDVPFRVAELLRQIRDDMYERAKKRMEERTWAARSMDEMREIFSDRSGFVKAMWCGCRECEDALKEELAVTSRCIPLDQEKIDDKCVVCGKPAEKMVYWGRAY